MKDLDEDNSSQFMAAGCVPASWRDARRIFRFALDDSAPFIDVEHQRTWTVLDNVLAPMLDARLDVSAVRGGDRLLTRAIAGWAYAQADHDGDLLYGGVRYLSRLGASNAGPSSTGRGS